MHPPVLPGEPCRRWKGRSLLRPVRAQPRRAGSAGPAAQGPGEPSRGPAGGGAGRADAPRLEAPRLPLTPQGATEATALPAPFPGRGAPHPEAPERKPCGRCLPERGAPGSGRRLVGGAPPALTDRPPRPPRARPSRPGSWHGPARYGKLRLPPPFGDVTRPPSQWRREPRREGRRAGGRERERDRDRARGRACGTAARWRGGDGPLFRGCRRARGAGGGSPGAAAAGKGWGGSRPWAVSPSLRSPSASSPLLRPSP